jgi:penicillin-binding protein 1B
VPVITKTPVRGLRVSRKAKLARFFTSRTGIILLSCVAVFAVVSITTFTALWVHYSRVIDEKLRGGPFSTTAKIYAAPETVGVGDPLTPSEVVADLRRGGYSESRSNAHGWYQATSDSVQIFPGNESRDSEAGIIRFANNKVSKIQSLSDHTQRTQFQLEPQLITNLYDRNREKRRLVKYEAIPPVLVHAVISIEDKRFFQHVGFDPLGMIRAMYVDVRDRRNTQGASTLSQQLAKMMFLTPDKTVKRKLEELMITLVLEQKLSKDEIFEFYSNQIDLGHRGSFTIRGFGEAAEAYLGKNLQSVSAAEAAMLAGMIQRPSYLNPYRHPDRVKERRNMVLSLMRQNGYITDRDYALAAESPIKVVNGASESSDAPYFVDLLNEELTTKFQDYDFQSQAYRIYTTLDMQLQHAANEAVRIGMTNVDEQLHKQKRFKNVSFPDAQVALIAVDPHTGEIKALVGGRNYGASQLNHAISKRQPGSIFKPWVYAAAMNTAITGGPRTLTPATIVVDEPTTFWFGDTAYEPNNFEHVFYGPVTLRRALAKSMNVATMKVAEMVGYSTIVNLARKAGINSDTKATPAVALGAYEATPVEMAGAYTVFGNKGVYVKPTFMSEIRGSSGKSIFQEKSETKVVLDPRVNYLMVSLLEEVMRSGTAAGTRSRGFTVPAGGKTGTSHDGWFAGFTSELLCIVWVGFDDNRVLDLEGARSALPIWTEFMKRALLLRNYRNAKPFGAPDGVVTMQIDPESGMPATPYCPVSKPEVFIAGTEPVGACPLHGGNGQRETTNVSGWELPPGVKSVGTANPNPNGLPAVPAPGQTASNPDSPPPKPDDPNNPSPPKKKGFLRKLFGVVK